MNISRNKTSFLLLTAIFVGLFISGCEDKEKKAAGLIREADKMLYNSMVTHARDLYLEAAELDPENPAVWYGIGVSWMNEEKWEKAIGYFDKAIALKSDFADAYYNRGQANFYLGEVYRACDDWQVAYDLGKPNMDDKLRKCD